MKLTQIAGRGFFLRRGSVHRGRQRALPSFQSRTVISAGQVGHGSSAAPGKTADLQAEISPNPLFSFAGSPLFAAAGHQLTRRGEAALNHLLIRADYAEAYASREYPL